MSSDTAGKNRGKTAPDERGRPVGKSRSPWVRRLLLLGGLVIAILVLLQISLSPLAKYFINKKLAAMPDYRGNVGKVTIALWRAGVDLGAVELFTRSGRTDLPLVQAKKVSAKLVPLALFAGKLKGEVLVDAADLNVVQNDSFPSTKPAEKGAEQAQEKKEEMKVKVASWQETLAHTFPIELSRFEVTHSKIRFIDPGHQPSVEVGIENLHILATGLRNRAEGEPLLAKVELTGKTTGDGNLKVNVQADPLSKVPRFEETMEIKQLSLPALNPFLLAYSGIDVAKGTFELYNEAKAEGGGYRGYVKPFLREVEFGNATNKHKPVIKKVEEKLANVAAHVLKNKDEQKVATESPFSGNFTDNNVDVWTTIDLLLRNAFIQGLKEGFTNQGPSK